MLCSNFIARILMAVVCKEGRQIDEEIFAAMCLPLIFKGLEAHFVALCVLSLELSVFHGVVLADLNWVPKYFQISVRLHEPHFLHFFKQFVPTILGNRLAIGVFVLLLNEVLELFIFLLVHLKLDWIKYVFEIFFLNLENALFTLAALSDSLLHAENALQLDRSQLTFLLKHVSHIIRVKLTNEVVFTPHRLNSALDLHSLFKLDLMVEFLRLKVCCLVKIDLFA